MNKKYKKILLIHNYYQEKGGEDIAFENEVELLSKNYEIKKIVFSNNIENKLNFIINFLFLKNLYSAKLVKETIENYKPDIIYVHNTWFNGSLDVFKIIGSFEIPTLIKLHNFRYFCTKSHFIKQHIKQFDSVCQACGMYRDKYTIYNKYFKKSYLKSFFVNRYGKKYYKILKSNKFNLLVLTDFHKQFLINLGFNKNKIFNFPNFIEFNLNSEIENNEKDYLVYAGRLSSEKGVELLITQFLKLNCKDLSLYIIGTGPQEDYLKNKYSNNKILFLGYLENSKVTNLIKNSKGVVTATKLFEGQPTLLIEASLNKVPSIFPSSGGINEFFPRNYQFEFEQYNYDDLFINLQNLITTDKRNAYGLQNYEFIINKLNSDKLLNRFEEILIEIEN